MILCAFRRHLSDITNDAGDGIRDDAEGGYQDNAKIMPRWCEGRYKGRYEVYVNNGENNNMNSDIKVLTGKRLARIWLPKNTKNDAKKHSRILSPCFFTKFFYCFLPIFSLFFGRVACSVFFRLIFANFSYFSWNLLVKNTNAPKMRVENMIKILFYGVNSLIFCRFLYICS
jgi:hypothetical protein